MDLFVPYAGIRIHIRLFFEKCTTGGAKVREKQLLIVQYRTLYLTPFLRYVLRKR